MQDKTFVGPSWDDLRRLLGKVEKPARYTGGELGAVRKDLEAAGVTFALAFPDVYEVGASHLGSQILYSVLNSLDFVACERVYMPWTDMEEILRAKGWPLFTIESRAPVGSFDIVGFSLQYELTYTNVLAMLDLAGFLSGLWTGKKGTRLSSPAVRAPWLPSLWRISLMPLPWVTERSQWSTSSGRTGRKESGDRRTEPPEEAFACGRGLCPFIVRSGVRWRRRPSHPQRYGRVQGACGCKAAGNQVPGRGAVP